jgi:hypothetical protein
MNMQRIIGAVALIIGVALLILGMNASHSVTDQVSNTFTGRFTQATTWYIVGGLATSMAGLVLVLFGRRARTV